MFGPDYTAGCPSCSMIADGFDGFVVHLANHDVTLCAVSRAPLPKLHAYKERMGWSFPWASSNAGDFNYDFGVAHTREQYRSGAMPYNFRERDFRPPTDRDSPWLDEIASFVGTDWETYRREGVGMSAFALDDDGVVYHTYSAYERGVDGLWGMYQWLDRAPLGRNAMDATPVPEPVARFAATCGTDARTYARERPGMSALAIEDGVVYHAYSTYARGLDGLWGMYQWLDRAPKGRNETGPWWRRHDEYDKR